MRQGWSGVGREEVGWGRNKTSLGKFGEQYPFKDDSDGLGKTMFCFMSTKGGRMYELTAHCN